MHGLPPLVDFYISMSFKGPLHVMPSSAQVFKRSADCRDTLMILSMRFATTPRAGGARRARRYINMGLDCLAHYGHSLSFLLDELWPLFH